MRALILSGAALVLCACATAPSEPKVVVQRVEIPVSIPCEAVVGPKPDYADTEAKLLAEKELYNRIRLLLAARLQRAAREDELTAALELCGVTVPEAK